MIYSLIADAGSSKTDWVLLDERGEEVRRVKTHGVNALLCDDAEVGALLDEVVTSLGDVTPDYVYFYGAGCASPAICARMRDALMKHLHAKEALVSSDLLGAARSLLGDEPGIACILGTGSNSCLYNGREIERNVPSLGFILGDEGSGAALGKRLVADVFKLRLPEALRDKFADRFSLDVPDILEKVYRQSAPNRFLASLVPFISENIGNPYIYSLVQREFSRFLRRNVSVYPGCRSLPVNFTGGIAYAFADIIREVAERKGIRIGKITAAPIDGLVEYHARHIASTQP